MIQLNKDEVVQCIACVGVVGQQLNAEPIPESEKARAELSALLAKLTAMRDDPGRCLRSV